MSSPEILRSESTTVFLNQPAVFTCETRGGITLWRVNGTQRELLLPDILRDLVFSEITTPERDFCETTAFERCSVKDTSGKANIVLISNGLPQPISTLWGAQSYLEDEYPVQQCSKHYSQIAYT